MRKRHFLRWSAIAVVTAYSALASAQAEEQAPELVEPLETDYPDVPGGFDVRQQAIEDSLKAKKAPIWAGHYYEGDGLGANISLTLAPDAGATVTWRGCMGLYGANHAAIVESPDGVLRMSFVAPNEPGTFGNFPNELIPVAWGERQYLIPPDEIAEFVSAVNHNTEPRRGVHGRFLLRDGDEAKPVSGLPVLPSSTPARVRQVPVEVKVESVTLRSEKKEEEFCSRVYVLRVAPVADAVPPLFVGERLRTVGGDFEIARVTALRGAGADVEVDSYTCDEAHRLKRGTTFTTGAYKEGQAAEDDE